MLSVPQNTCIGPVEHFPGGLHEICMLHFLKICLRGYTILHFHQWLRISADSKPLSSLLAKTGAIASFFRFNYFDSYIIDFCAWNLHLLENQRHHFSLACLTFVPILWWPKYFAHFFKIFASLTPHMPLQLEPGTSCTHFNGIFVFTPQSWFLDLFWV